MAVASYEETKQETDARARWHRRINEAQKERQRFEGNWLQNLAHVAGKQHLEWNPRQRRLILPNLPAGRERYTADIITQYRNTALGELSLNDDRPELLLRNDDSDASDESFAQQLNLAVGYGWESEWNGDNVLLNVRRTLIDLGTCAVRVRFDPTKGPALADVPHRNGKPILDEEEARSYVADTAEAGGRAEIRSIHEGRLQWELLTPFNLLVPPGIYNENEFPWEVVVRPILLDSLIEEYGAAAADLKADTDIGSVMGLSTDEKTDDVSLNGTGGMLHDHVWLYTCYERPCRKYPKGQVTLLAGRERRVLKTFDELPFVGPDETPRSGISYFHFWRVTGRFWSMALMDPMKDPQRAYNKRRSQTMEIIDRSMPYLIANEGTLHKKPKGLIMELVELKKGDLTPQPVQGIGPGNWMWEDSRAIKEDLEAGVGIRPVSLGENPSGVGNYSQLAMLRENDQIKMKGTQEDWQISVKALVEPTVNGIQKYWGKDKHISLVNEDDSVQAFRFDSTKIPPFFIVRTPKGATKPRSQAAELKLIEDVWRASMDSQQPLPLSWLKESLEQGKTQPIPEGPTDDQREKAELENRLLSEGNEIVPTYYDDHEIHLPVHRSAQIQAELSGQPEVWQFYEDHVQMHLAVAQANAAGQQQHMEENEIPPDDPAAEGQQPAAPTGGTT